MLSLDVRGGLNNQRECVINGIIAAAELGLTLVLPRVHPIGRGNEKYAPHDAAYEGRFAGMTLDTRRKWAHWESLFNATAAQALLGRAGILQHLCRVMVVDPVPLPAQATPFQERWREGLARMRAFQLPYRKVLQL